MPSSRSTRLLTAVLWLAACGTPAATPARTDPEPPASPGPGQGQSAAAKAPPPAPAPAPAPQTAEAVARAYLERGSRSEDVRELVDPSCHENQDIMRVDAIRVMGVPMTLRSLTVTPGAIEGSITTVTYEAAGSAHAEESETTIMGAHVKIRGVNVDNASQRGSLRMVQADGRWRVGCTPAPDGFGAGLGASGTGRGGS